MQLSLRESVFPLEPKNSCGVEAAAGARSGEGAPWSCKEEAELMGSDSGRNSYSKRRVSLILSSSFTSAERGEAQKL